MATYDAFISHSSKDTSVAARIEKALETEYTVWLDHSDLHLGVLLRKELQQNIEDSRVVILLWSEPAAASRWIAAEVLTAYHLDRFIVPCALDETPLPLFLDSTVYLDLRHDEAAQIERLRRRLHDAPNTANALLPRKASRSPECNEVIRLLNQEQHEMLDRIPSDEARQWQQHLDGAMQRVLAMWPFDAMILNLAGYHYKNAYLLKHWDAIQAGRSPKDPLLEQAERFFFDSLFVDPNDYNALNGLGSVLILERELEAAEFFVRRALDLAAQAGIDYDDAKHDLALIQYYRQP